MPVKNVGSSLKVAETEVFSGTSPATWTDLDLSGTIGAKASLVYLKVYMGTGKRCAFRKKGDTDEVYTLAANSGASQCEPTAHDCVLVPTDDSGVVQWKTETATGSTTVDVIAYIN